MNLTGTWPIPGDPADPFADEAFSASGFADYRNAGGSLTRERYDELQGAFRELLADLRTGRAHDVAPLATLAAELRLDLAPDHERHTSPHLVPRVPSHGELARITTDLCPAGGAEAPERLLGPLALDLDLLQPAHRATALAALAAFCFTLPDGAGRADGRSSQHGRTPFEQWARRKPIPPLEHRAEVRALARAPLGLWSLEARVDGGWRVADLLGLASHVVPDGPVSIPELGAPWRPARPGDTLIARIALTESGWEGRCAVALPTSIPRRRLNSWLTLALWEARLLHRQLTIEDLLRRHSHSVFRNAVEWAWLQGDDDPYRDPVLYDLEYQNHHEDLDHYGALALRLGGPVLELGCGTGRLSLSLARLGLEVDGVDLSEPMLEGLARRVAGEPDLVAQRIRAWPSDFRTVQLDRTYPLVLWPFNALHHCRGPGEIRQVLDRVRTALAPQGLLAVDCYLPALELYDRNPADRIEERTFTRPDTGETLTSWERGWWDPDLRVHHVVYVYQRPDGSERHTHLQLRMYELAELRALFKDAGWRLLSEAEDFQGTPVGPDSLKWVGLLAPR